MEDRKVSYIVHEGVMARFERTIKRLIILIVAIIIALFVSNITWLYFWNVCGFGCGCQVCVESEEGK